MLSAEALRLKCKKFAYRAPPDLLAVYKGPLSGRNGDGERGEG